MADGKGCTCAAYYPGECACDADWTSQEVYDLRAKVAEYETWFRANAALLATHRIGGYAFEPSPNATKVDPVHGTIIRAETTGQEGSNG